MNFCVKDFASHDASICVDDCIFFTSNINIKHNNVVRCAIQLLGAPDGTINVFFVWCLSGGPSQRIVVARCSIPFLGASHFLDVRCLLYI